MCVLVETVLYKDNTGHEFAARSLDTTGNNIMDRWILADCQSMLRFIHGEMQLYGSTKWDFEKLTLLMPTED